MTVRPSRLASRAPQSLPRRKPGMKDFFMPSTNHPHPEGARSACLEGRKDPDAARTAMIRPRRSLLFMPGTNSRALDKVRELGADGLIFVLEVEDQPVSPQLTRLIERSAIGARHEQQAAARSDHRCSRCIRVFASFETRASRALRMRMVGGWHEKILHPRLSPGQALRCSRSEPRRTYRHSS